MKILIAIIAIVFLAFLVRNVMMLSLSLENYNVHKKRLKQLQTKKSPLQEEVELSGLIEQITKPIIEMVFSRFRPRKLDVIERQLVLAKWDKTMSAVQYRALDMVFKFLGVFFAILLSTKSLIFGLIIGAFLFFLLPVGLSNGYKERKKKLIQDLPDFIRVTEGYLSSGMPFAEAVTRSMQYVGPEWNPILKQFAIDIELHGSDIALEKMKAAVDIFEVREFVALVRLTLEQGGDMADSFRQQADRMREVQRVIMMQKIAGRQAMGVFIQMPIMLMDFVIFGLPTFYDIIGLTSGKI